MRDEDIATLIRGDFHAGDVPAAPIAAVSHRIRMRNSVPRNTTFSIRAITAVLILSTTGFALAGTSQVRNLLVSTREAFVAKMNTALRQLMNTTPSDPGAVSLETKVQIPHAVLDMHLVKVVKIGDSPETYSVAYAGGVRCTASFELTIRPGTGSDPLFIPLNTRETMFAVATRRFSMMGSGDGCAATLPFVRAFLAAQ
jgi:hypothetical protein